MGYEKVIFVCTGNTCRSPMAEAICKSELKCTGTDGIEVVSRGIMVYPGDEMNGKAKNALIKHKIPLSCYQEQDLESGNSTCYREQDLESGRTACHPARSLEPADIRPNTLILTMTWSHKVHLENEFPAAVRKKCEIYTLKEFAGEHGDVADPFGGSQETYDACCAELKILVGKIVQRIKEKR